MKDIWLNHPSMLFRLSSLLIILFLLDSCREPEMHIERGFYFWKNSTSNLSGYELEEMQKLKLQKLYVKFFEVEKNEELGLIPAAKTSLYIGSYARVYFDNAKDSLLGDFISKLDIVPVIFIRNEIFNSSSVTALDTLADNINFLTRKYYREKMGRDTNELHEIQIDCDWTIKTKDKYFYLLKALKKISGKTLSCTLRLYPYKYPGQMGVPPVEKATLMCYNLVNPFMNEDENSILSITELNKYLDGAKKYPLHLDIVLPVFSWMQVYHQHAFAGMLNENDLDIQKILQPVKPMWYEVRADTAVGDLYLKAGDKIKFEEVTESTIDSTITLLKKHELIGDSTTVSFFHLDENVFKKYSDEKIDHFYTASGN